MRQAAKTGMQQAAITEMRQAGMQQAAEELKAEL